MLGCRQFEDLARFELEYTTNVTVPSAGGINLPVNINTPPVATNTESKLENNSTRPDLVEEIFLTSMTIELTSPEGEDFSFLENITIYISADGMEEKEVSYLRPVPQSSGSKISLNVTDDNLRSYLLKDEFSLRVNVTTDEVISQDHDFEVVSVYDVKAKIF